MINIGYFIVVVFGSLTIYYIWNDYKQGKMSKKSFTTVCFMETVVVIASLISLLTSLF